MAHWSFGQHMAFMAGRGVSLAPRTGDGRAGTPLLEAGGASPRRDVGEERRWIEWYLTTEPAGSVERAEVLAAAMEPMLPQCRLSVLLPCRNEAPYVSGMLDMLRRQHRPDGSRLEPSSYEIIVLCNTFEDEPRDATADHARAVAASSDVPIHVLDYQHPASEPAPLTTARKLLADVAVLRGLRRPEQRAPLYLACEDADIVWLDPCQLFLQVTTLDRDAALDAVRGQQDRCPWLLVRMPVILLMRRSWFALETHLSRPSLRPDRNVLADFNWNRIVTSGWNTAFTAEAYARIGGYTPHRRFEEDMDIGESLSVLRAFERQGLLVPQVNTTGWTPTRSEGAPRRWIYRVTRDVEPYLDHNNYENFFDAGHEMSIKFGSEADWIGSNRDLLELGPRGLDMLGHLLSRDLAFARATIKDPVRADAVYARVLRTIGFGPDAAVIDGNRVAVLCADSVQPGLDRVGNRRMAPFDASLHSSRRRAWWTAGGTGGR